MMTTITMDRLHIAVWLDKNKWFVLACIVLMYGAWAHRYQYLASGVLLDRWTQSVVRISDLFNKKAGTDFSRQLFNEPAWKSDPIIK